ncbi:MAG: DOMON domain-containing protein [Dehalococcoidia bacterium]
MTWTADGIISPGEYQNRAAFDDYEINWSNDDQYVYIGMKAKTMGWVAVGFGATTFMNNANIIQGYFSSGKAMVADQYSSGNFGPHVDVTTLGGTYAILNSGGTQANGITIIEFKRKLDPGDKLHAALVKGANKIIWAYGGDNQYLIKHVTRGHGEILIK